LHATAFLVLHFMPLLYVYFTILFTRHFILSAHLCSACMQPLVHICTLFEHRLYVYPSPPCLYATVLSARCCLVFLTLHYLYLPACSHLNSLYSTPSLPPYMHVTASSWAQVYRRKFLQNGHVGHS
jgi:hypothetical protein